MKAHSKAGSPGIDGAWGSHGVLSFDGFGALSAATTTATDSAATATATDPDIATAVMRPVTDTPISASPNTTAADTEDASPAQSDSLLPHPSM